MYMYMYIYVVNTLLPLYETEPHPTANKAKVITHLIHVTHHFLLESHRIAGNLNLKYLYLCSGFIQHYMYNGHTLQIHVEHYKQDVITGWLKTHRTGKSFHNHDKFDECKFYTLDNAHQIWEVVLKWMKLSTCTCTWLESWISSFAIFINILLQRSWLLLLKNMTKDKTYHIQYTAIWHLKLSETRWWKSCVGV